MLSPDSLVLQDATPGIWTEVASEEKIRCQLRKTASEPFTLAVKANISVAGFIRSAACRALHKQPELTDAPAVTALRQCGAVVVGMTNMDELALGVTTNNPAFGQATIPGFPEFSAGGSSGGSAAAVAEGSATLGLGTDTGGSVSIPASHCGVYGFRPTTGRWPTAGLAGLSWTRGTPGVLAGSVQTLLRADEAVTAEPSYLFDSDTKPLRLGIPHQFVDDLAPHTAHHWNAVVSTLSDTATTVPVDLAPVLELTRAAEMPTVLWEAKRLLSSVASEVFQLPPAKAFELLAHRVDNPELAAALQSEIERPTDVDHYETAQRNSFLARRIYTEIITENALDGLLFPTTPAPAPPVGTDVVQHRGRTEDVFHLYTRHVGQGTMVGAPMVTIPQPVAPGTLPVGVTLQGARFQDRKILVIAQQLSNLNH